MFYETNPNNALRFGDIVKGFVLSSACIDKPSAQEIKREYSIEVKRPDYAVVLSPCCSIGDHTIALSPLVSVLPDFFLNPYIREDLSRINRFMTPEQAVPPDVWRRLSPEDQQRRVDFASREPYGYVEYFVYAAHDLLPRYILDAEIKKKSVREETGYYMIDFRKLYRIECKQVSSAQSAPIETKWLQLSLEARSELRDKLSFYFGREPPEDRV